MDAHGGYYLSLHPDEIPSYLSMRRRVIAYPDRSGCVGIVIGLMYIGIETDGYTHT